MTHTIYHYKGFQIQKRKDIKTHTCQIYKGAELIKCIAGNINPDGSENSIEKAKTYINSINYENLPESQNIETPSIRQAIDGHNRPEPVRLFSPCSENKRSSQCWSCNRNDLHQKRKEIICNL